MSRCPRRVRRPIGLRLMQTTKSLDLSQFRVIDGSAPSPGRPMELTKTLDARGSVPRCRILLLSYRAAGFFPVSHRSAEARFCTVPPVSHPAARLTRFRTVLPDSSSLCTGSPYFSGFAPRFPTFPVMHRAARYSWSRTRPPLFPGFAPSRWIFLLSNQGHQSFTVSQNRNQHVDVCTFLSHGADH